MNNKIIKYYPFLPLLLLCSFYGYKSLEFPIHDFSNYYFGGKFLADGNFDSKMYFPYQFNKAISFLGYQNIFANYAPNTPFLAFFFLPFSLISVDIAKLLFNAISISLFVISVFRLFSFYEIKSKWALLIPILFLFPIKNNLLFGQIYFLMFFLLAEGWMANEKERYKQMAFFWALAILLKVFPAILIALLLFRKQWKAFLYLVLSCIILLGISLFYTGIDIWIFYLKEVLPRASNGEIASSFVDNYQSVFMFLKRLFVYNEIENPNPLFHVSWLQSLFFGFKILLLTLCYFITRNLKKNLTLFSLWILIMILLSPYGSTYSFILLIFSFLAILKSDISNTLKLAFCVTLILINNLPLSLFIGNDLPFSYLRLYLLIAFFITFVLVYQETALLRAIIIGFIAFGLGIFLEHQTTHKDKLLAGTPLLVYDYKIENNQLIYSYWNQNGENLGMIPFKTSSVKVLDINKNQIIWKSKILTSDTSNKYKPLLVDNKTVIYLSDYDRGIGFYTLRKIELY